VGVKEDILVQKRWNAHTGHALRQATAAWLGIIELVLTDSTIRLWDAGQRAVTKAKVLSMDRCQ
jgi:hypothetical protein